MNSSNHPTYIICRRFELPNPQDADTDQEEASLRALCNEMADMVEESRELRKETRRAILEAERLSISFERVSEAIRDWRNDLRKKRKRREQERFDVEEKKTRRE